MATILEKYCKVIKGRFRINKLNVPFEIKEEKYVILRFLAKKMQNLYDHFFVF